jgi:hypothetical protein
MSISPWRLSYEYDYDRLVRFERTYEERQRRAAAWELRLSLLSLAIFFVNLGFIHSGLLYVSVVTVMITALCFLVCKHECHYTLLAIRARKSMLMEINMLRSRIENLEAKQSKE